MIKHNGHNVVKSKELIPQILGELDHFLFNFTEERERIENIYDIKKTEIQELEEQKKREFELLDTKFSDLHAELDRTKQQLKEQFVE